MSSLSKGDLILVLEVPIWEKGPHGNVRPRDPEDRLYPMKGMVLEVDAVFGKFVSVEIPQHLLTSLWDYNEMTLPEGYYEPVFTK